MKKFIILISLATALISTISQANTLIVGGLYSQIPSIVNGEAVTEGGGSIDPSYLDGRQLDYLYCVDLFTNIYGNDTYNATTISSDGYIRGAEIANAGRVAWLLTNYRAEGQGYKAIALQAAIWNLTSGQNGGNDIYRLNTAITTPETNSLYNTMLNDSFGKTGKISDFIWLTPGKNSNGTAYQGLVASAPVPEPATMLLFGSGIIGLAGLVRKHKKQGDC